MAWDIAISPLQRQSKELLTLSKEAVGPIKTTTLSNLLCQMEEGVYWVEVSGRWLV